MQGSACARATDVAATRSATLTTRQPHWTTMTTKTTMTTTTTTTTIMKMT
jgi:hypothetical protein